MKKPLFPLSLLALAIGPFAAPAFADNGDVTAWRLFVADHDQPVVNVIDALDGDNIATFTVKGPATLHRSESGETVFAVQGSANTVSAIASGIAFHDHGDHGDIDIDPPRLLSTTFSGQKPGHFVERQGKVAQWFDKEKSAMLFTEQAVLKQKADTKVIDVVAAHHGVAVPFDHYAVVSIPNPEDASKRPVGARVVDESGKKVGEDVACPGLHGSAGSGSLYALACDKGLLLLTQQGKVPQITLLPYSASLPQGSASTLIGGKGLQYFIGNYGPDRIVLIDPAEKESFRLLQLPTRRVHFAVDPLRAKFAYVITEDGKLHQIDVLKGQITQSLKVTGPYSMDGHWNDPRPRIAVAGDKIVVTDPLNSRLHLIDALTFKESGTVAVAGKPFNIVAVGGSGQSHGDHDDHHH
ncbi:zinc metallochaperone AztD [Erwinia sp. V71]|uniref:zinc metallochaperone AztD n=1 Tax=Erwinia sp. V71 TaxID=3369424 RepID=UPI003F5D8AD2